MLETVTESLDAYWLLVLRWSHRPPYEPRMIMSYDNVVEVLPLFCAIRGSYIPRGHFINRLKYKIGVYIVQSFFIWRIWTFWTAVFGRSIRILLAAIFTPIALVSMHIFLVI
jgi:hypothetical protein